MPRPVALPVRCALVPLWTVMFACACSHSSTEHQADSAVMGEPRLELGQGELAFETLSDDEALPYVAGSQGGHHVFVSFKAENLDPKRMHVRVTTSVADHPELVLTREGRVNFSPSETDASPAPAVPGDAPASSYVFAGWPAQILFAPCHVGEAVLIEATITDLNMQSASDARTIRIAMPEHAAELECPPPP